MPSPVHIPLTTPLAELDGVTPRKAALLHRLGLNTVADLLKHLPYRFEFYAGQSPIVQLPVDTIATVTGTVANCRWVGPQSRTFGKQGKGRFQLTLTDDTGSLDVVFFNAHYLVGKIVAGMPLIVTGKVTRFNDYPQMVNPKWQSAPAPGSSDGSTDGVAHDEKLRPVYPATENLPSEQIAQFIEQILPGALTQIDDHFDADYRKARALPELADAYRMLHAPDTEDEAKSARRRLAYDELLLLQLGLTINRHYTRTQFRAPALRWSPAIDKHIRARFPFMLTDAQDKVVRELAADLQKSQPANRLIQGDVGSGKTVVALYAMLLAVADRKQAALMAPTELLAEQHFASISAMLAGSNVRLALLTGSIPPADRAALIKQIATSGGGGIDIVIATHALLTESVRFNDLAVVIVDEQHRFGVKQRAALRSNKSASSAPHASSLIPHTLVMTATPIPRTLCLALFGDMDVSTITALPPGRQPIDTRVVSPEKTDEVYRYLAKRIDKGEQLYVVVPAIDDSPAHLKAVTSHAKNIQDHYFRNHKVAAVHGRLQSATRDRIMRQFRDHQIDILVATTVIEVGVDVPNASLMVVEHAERFGLAQLHQLRGRVGRGSKRSLCVYIAEPTTDDAAQRLAAIANTTDGFAIAEADSNIRGMGELIGTRQSGLPPLQIADLATDLDLLRMARRDAIALVENDPRLTHPSHALLRGRLVKQYGPALGLADVM
ncbi:MAG: ATP-dependent DNA helicase RecG [Phycisphaeraceae bacterium]